MSKYNLVYFNEEWNKKDIAKDSTNEAGMARRSSGTNSGKEQEKVQSKK